MIRLKKPRTVIQWRMIRPEVSSEPARVWNVPIELRRFPYQAHRGVIIVRKIKGKKISIVFDVPNEGVDRGRSHQNGEIERQV